MTPEQLYLCYCVTCSHYCQLMTHRSIVLLEWSVQLLWPYICMTCEGTAYRIRPTACSGLSFIDGGDDDMCQTLMNDWKDSSHLTSQNLFVSLTPTIIYVNLSGRMSLVWYVAYMGQKGNTYRVLCVKPKDRPLWRCRQICEDDVKTNLQSVGEQGMKWIDVAEERDSWLQSWTFDFHNVLGISAVANELRRTLLYIGGWLDHKLLLLTVKL
jgi:hypothetical protein